MLIQTQTESCNARDALAFDVSRTAADLGIPTRVSIAGSAWSRLWLAGGSDAIRAALAAFRVAAETEPPSLSYNLVFDVCGLAGSPAHLHLCAASDTDTDGEPRVMLQCLAH